MTEPSGDRLESWKEIAAYLNRGVRTVRRWEHEEGLPVHRHQHRTLGSVYAFKSEIDAWRQSGSRAPRPRPAADPEGGIAVLPFANLSADAENAYLADGLTEEIASALASIRALRVISRRSAMTLKQTDKDARTIARELGVRYLVEGSVRRAGARLRIAVHLIDAHADRHLWSDKYDGAVDDVFEMQERAARTIAGALALRLTPDEERRLAARPIDSVPAYECYLQARQEVWRWRKDAIDRAIQLLQRGLEMIGDNAVLYASLGFAWLQYREAGIDLSDRPLDEADACARQVDAMEPGSAASLQLRGWIDYSHARIEDAVRDLKASLEIEPNHADSLLLLINCYLISGRVAQARPLLDRLLAIDPLTPLTRCMPAFADALEGRPEAAIGAYRQMLEMDPANPLARLFCAWALALNRRDAEVRAVVEGFPAETRATIAARVASFLDCALRGDRAAAESLVTPEMTTASAATDVFPRFLAEGFALLGSPDAALPWLQRAIDRGFINYPFLAEHDPLLANLRAEPQFARMLEGIRERWERFES